MHRLTRVLAPLGAALVVGLSALTPASPATAAPPVDAAVCASLVGTTIDPDAIDLPTGGAVVTGAEWVTETNGQCRVTGRIDPVDPTAPYIGFQVNLPDNWNSRAMQMGGGGLNGTLVTATGPYRYQPPGQPTPLQEGFVTLGSDGGHQGAGGSFALNDEALWNYGQYSIKKTHDVSMALIAKVYETQPDYFYFVGFSQGGHEALDAAGRYWEDYDGVVAGTPAYDVEMMHLGIGSVYRDALYADGGSGWVNPAKQDLLVNAVYATCDPIDGLADGIISDTEGCLDAFDVQSLRCPDGADTGDTCLSDVQIATLDTLARPQDVGVEIAGNSIAAPSPIYNGALLNLGRYSLGHSPQPSNPAAPTDAWHFQVLDTMAKYFITKDPTLDTLNDFDVQEYADRIQELGTILDTTSVDFGPARDAGVKVLLYTGMSDDGISPYNTIQFYDRQVARMGQQAVDDFLKFYTIPGMAHGFGNFVAGFDSFPALQAWVEDGVEPGQLTAVDTVAATAGRTRPVCEYPSWPRYTGTSPDDAASFTCVLGEDDTAPTVEVSVVPVAPDGEADWYTSAPSVTATATDDTDAAPIVEYRWDEGEWAAYTGPVTADLEGEHSLAFRATDASGNASDPVTWASRVDLTAPEVVASADRADGTIVVSATDTASGVAGVEYSAAPAEGDEEPNWTAYTGPIPVTTDTARILVRASDAAGHVSEPVAFDYNAGLVARLTVSPASAVPGATIQVSGTGLPVGDHTLVLRSDPVTVGQVSVDASGRLSASFTLPRSTAAGTHTVQVVDADGVVVASAQLTVTASAGGTLPATGAPAGLGLAAVLGGLLAAAGGAVILRRRRTLMRR